MKNQINAKSGFTLVELAIVIVIIGLLVGGVLQGQELIKAAKSQRLMKDFQTYEAAYRLFESKYNCLPGDCINAQTYLGPGVTNGNGNRRIGTASGVYESIYSWDHLATAKMISGSYTGVNTGGTKIFDVGVNMPASTYSDDVGIMFVNYTTGDITGSVYGIYASTRNTIITGKEYDTDFTWKNSYITPQDTYLFDLKYDDGKASTGKIFGGSWINNGTCTLVSRIAQTYSDDYNLSNTDQSCSLIYNIE